MEINFNSTFKSLLDEYKLPSNLDFDVDLPIEVQEILDNNIVADGFGVRFESKWAPFSKPEPQGQSFFEDFENHFHVDWFIENINNKKAFEVA